MLFFNRLLKAQYSLESIDIAKNELEELTSNKKSFYPVSKASKAAFLTYLIGEDDPYDLVPQLKAIYAKMDEYLAIADRSNSLAQKIETTKLRNQVLHTLVQLNGQLQQSIPANVYQKYIGQSRILGAFWPPLPSVQFDDQTSTQILNNMDESQYSRALVNPGIQIKFDEIAVGSPASSTPYIYLSEIFDSKLLVHALGANVPSAWSKYTTGRTTPIATNWGLFLLGLGLHPTYMLCRRQQNTYQHSQLFADLFPNWAHRFNHEIWEQFEANELQPYHTSKKIEIDIMDMNQLRHELKDLVKQWFVPDKVLVTHMGENGPECQYGSAEEVFDELDRCYAGLTANPQLWKKINGLILALSQHKIFNQSRTSQFIAAYSQHYHFKPDLAKKILKHARIALFLYLESNPNPAVYTMLRYMADPNGNMQVINTLSGTSHGTWNKYEQGLKFPKNYIWTATLLALDLHPVYQLEVRTDKQECKEVGEIYRQLHVPQRQ